MSETTTCGIYFENLPTTNYGTQVGLGYFIKILASNIVHALSIPVDIATGILSEMTYTDEINLNSLMSILCIMYDVRGSDEFRDFLKNNISLAPLVSEAYKKLQVYFPYSTIFAEVIEDELVISVGTTLAPREAKVQLYKFDEDWWLDIAANLRSKICITVEFQ